MGETKYNRSDGPYLYYNLSHSQIHDLFFNYCCIYIHTYVCICIHVYINYWVHLAWFLSIKYPRLTALNWTTFRESLSLQETNTPSLSSHWPLHLGERPCGISQLCWDQLVSLYWCCLGNITVESSLPWLYPNKLVIRRYTLL